MSLNVSADLFCGAELNFHSTDEMDDDYERYDSVSVYSRHIMRALRLEIPEDFDDESLSEGTGLRVLDCDGRLFLAIDSTVNEVSGNGVTKVTVKTLPGYAEAMFVRAMEAIGNDFVTPEWLMVTNYN
jgi:hypothetical protein